ACHTLQIDGKPAPGNAPKADLTAITRKESEKKGCLAEDARARGNAPQFKLAKQQLQEVRDFLRDGLGGVGSPAAAYEARAQLHRRNGLACHSRDGEGGLSTALLEQLRKYENVEHAESVMPPPLTGVAHKLRTSWFRQVLVDAGRARPWMGLRMPQF